MAKGQKSAADTTPKKLAEVTPSSYAEAVGATYLVESMMQMQHSLGELNASVARLVEDVRSQGDKIDGLRHQASYIKGGLAVAVVLVGAFVGIASFIVNSRWETVSQAIHDLEHPEVPSNSKNAP